MPQCQFLFSAVFVFQKSCSRNILGIGRNKSRSSYFSVTKTESKGETEKSREAASPPLGAARAGPRLGLVWAPRGSSPSRLLAPWVFGWNMDFAIFSWNFPKSRISAQKRDTRAILLKTVSVCVSCIQNTQDRGQTIAKVFGKVDTFWTYQLPQA